MSQPPRLPHPVPTRRGAPEPTRQPYVVMASGVWDLFHRGHVNLLWRASRLGDVLMVGVVTDEGAAAYKGRPCWSLEQRLAAVRSLPFVGYAEPQEGTDPTPLLERWRPDLLVHGDDWEQLLQGQETVERLGVQWRLLPYTPGVCTTSLKAALSGPAG